MYVNNIKQPTNQQNTQHFRGGKTLEEFYNRALENLYVLHTAQSTLCVYKIGIVSVFI